MKKIIDLYPEAPNEWLWRDHAEDVKREFYPSVSIPAQDEPLWHECTDAQRRDWEAQHPEPAEPSPEPSESEPVAGVVEPEQEVSEADNDNGTAAVEA